jgi:hypothetical protein
VACAPGVGARRRAGALDRSRAVGRPRRPSVATPATGGTERPRVWPGRPRGRRLLQRAAGLVGHEHDRALDLDVGQIRVAALGGHHAGLALEAGDRVLEQRLLALRERAVHAALSPTFGAPAMPAP